jgi:NAD(P)-dependent dehydrogenase (short-subunit alcohol dehydrogenase family)
MAKMEGKAAIVTGATGGIGEATARRFLDEGASVMLVGRSMEKLIATRDRLSSGQRVAISVAEATDEAAMEVAVAATVNAFGGVDILFANAGMTGPVPIEVCSLARFEQILLTNVVGVWLPMKHCVEAMKKRGGGSIVATASIAGVSGIPGLSAYAASKHAVCGLVKTAALELATSRIRVNAIAPGPIDNQMMQAHAELMAPDNPGSVRTAFEAAIPMQRYGTNEEVAKLVGFLASDDASYCTGGIFMVDGGFAAA